MCKTVEIGKKGECPEIPRWY